MINYDIVNSFIGKDWVYVKNDCWAVVRKASKDIFGLDLPLVDLPSVSDVGENITLFYEASKSDDWEIIKTPVSGCIVLFYGISGRPVHIGIYIDGGDVLHCDGGPKRPGKTSYEQLKDILGYKYRRAEFYAYNRNP